MKPPPGKPATLIQQLRDDDDDEEQFKPLEWGLIRRLFTYTVPIKGKVTVLCIMSLIRAAQLPALVWLMSLIIQGPISHTGQDFSMDVAGFIISDASSGIMWGVIVYGLIALSTDVLFHFRQRYALEIGETVVNALREEIFSKYRGNR